MGSLKTGGGSSAVASSAHAGCERYRKTDPLIVGTSRREIAATLGHPDTSAGIPLARWIRAMTFERLVRDEKFVSQLVTTAVGALGLERPSAVRRADGKVSETGTAAALADAHIQAVDDNVATMITGLAVPFVGMESEPTATPTKPDFAIIARRVSGDSAGSKNDRPAVVGSWLIMGDAKDYERVRSRIDDQRMLKGFLQVALGAESAAAWSAIPDDMVVHHSGVLAVPRNAFLQPEAVVEQLDDHRREVRARVDERTELMDQLGGSPVKKGALPGFIEHLVAEFDPASCPSCSLFNFCRNELRTSTDPEAILIELGVPPEMRPSLAPVLEGGEVGRAVPDSVAGGVRATLAGLAEWTGQCRVDPAGRPGTINVVHAKSDAAALGVHGIGLQRVTVDGSVTPWDVITFDEPQSPTTRLTVMELLGGQIDAAMTDLDELSPGTPGPVHLVIPDSATGDVLVSIADSLAGVETSRLRWQRDLDMGREALTFDGEPANVPKPLSDLERLAVSFLLEEDRARAMRLRWPLVDLRSALARHVIPGGPNVDTGRLDYLVEWAEATTALDHRAVSDTIESLEHTPGARLSNVRSDAIQKVGRARSKRAKAAATADPKRYRALVLEELGYKAQVLERSIAILESLPDSQLRAVHRALETGAQDVWRRRLELHASDLVRFGRTSWVWRNSHVDMLDADGACESKLLALGNPQTALDLAFDAGTREVASATVLSIDPIRLDIDSRRIVDGSTIVALQINSQPCIEADDTTLKIQKGSFKFGNLSLGPLAADAATLTGQGLLWDPVRGPAVAVGDELVIADAFWFGKILTSGHEINVDRPKADRMSAPKDECDESSYEDDPDEHQWCCRSHEDSEAEWSDTLAERRENGELNPQTWPPVIDEDQFDTPAAGSPTADDAAEAAIDGPANHLTIDDLD